MSESFFCLDCTRSVTFLKIGSKKHMGILMEKVPITALFDSSLTYVRCAVCITSKGRLSSGKNSTESAFKVPHGTQQILVKNIATFLKKPECEIAVVTSGPCDMSKKPAYMNIDEALETSLYGLACLSLDYGEPRSAYTDFYSKFEWDSRQIPDTEVNSQVSSNSEERTVSQDGEVAHVTDVELSSGLEPGKNNWLSSYSKRIVTQITKVANAIEGPLDLFCLYCKPNEVDACYGNSFMAYVEETKVKMYPHFLTGADTLVIFTCDTHRSTHPENMTAGTEPPVPQVRKAGLEKLRELWEPMTGLANGCTYTTILDINSSEPHLITQLDLELRMWILWSGYYDYYPLEFDTFESYI
jgi:hypothetical protein